MTTFEWDAAKAVANARNHGIRFADAVSVLEDDMALTMQDESTGEERWVTIGIDALGRVLVVVYTWRGKTICLISARPSTKPEVRQYLENL